MLQKLHSSLSVSVGQLSKGRTDIGQTFQELISDIISVLCDKRNEEISETAVSIFVFSPFYCWFEEFAQSMAVDLSEIKKYQNMETFLLKAKME